MRVLLVHNFYRLAGGEDSVVRDELSMLRANGIETDLFSVDSKDICSPLDQILTGLQVVYSLRARRALSRKIAEFAPDVIHIHNFFPLLSPSILDACRLANVPVVMTLHNFRILCPTGFLYGDARDRERSLRQSCWWTVRKRVYRSSVAATMTLAAMVEFHKWVGTWRQKVDRFIALSPSARDKFIEGGLPANRIIIKPNCVSRAGAFPNVNRQGALFVGRLDEQKGLPTLLQAWKNVDYPLKIVGEGPLADLVLQNTSSSVSYLGKVPREAVKSEMQAAKFLVLPSIGHEMFPVTVLEAFSCGLPVICSDLPSLHGLVEVGFTGLKFRPGDSNSLAEVVRHVVTQPTKLDDYGRNALRVYEEGYTPEANFKRLMDIYNDVLRVRSNPALAGAI
ncbi:glycosyltransferase family 4 protein [Microvirga arabica]|uniref:Glycosyltransferase family 4 protein n=1 Tax=Microvirga arabica TaxID=1128671 RepID=A0ABV6YDR3_9HYPH